MRLLALALLLLQQTVTGTANSLAYSNDVQSILASKPWLKAGF